MADFNHDGNLDILTANSRANPATISLLLGKGDGTFLPETEMPVLTKDAASFVTVGDFNHDGNPDLALAAGTVVVILLGNGNGNFQAPATYSLSNFVNAIAIADLNHDGRLDLAVTTGSDIDVLLGNGDGTFQPASIVGTTGVNDVFSSLAISDLNGDGKPDIAAVSFSANAVYVFLGKGDGTFHEEGTHYVSGALGLATADFNGDGKTDIAAISRGFTSIFLGVGDGTFGLPENFASAGTPQAITVGDFNRDGKPDLAVVDYEPFNVSILTNTTK